MAGYTRNDTLNNIADGNVISAADLDGEFDAIDAAFDEATGHVHDGTANNGAPITKIGPAQDLVVSTGAVTPKTDNAVDLGTSSFEFKDLYIDGTANIDSLVADTADINAGTIDGVTLGTNSAVTQAQIDNININGNAIITTDTNGNLALTPNGTGEVDISKVDIDSGTIDGTTIGGASAAAGTFTNLTASGTVNFTGATVSNGGTFTIIDINGGSIDGVTIGTNSAVTDLRVDNLQLNGNTISSTDTNGNIAITPNGTGEVDISKVDIDSGAIDGTTIGGSTPAVGSFTQANVDNLRLDGNALTSTDTNGNIDLTPNGTGEVNISKVDIDSGEIDGTTIGGASAAAGTFTNLTATGTVTIPDNAISGDKVEGGTINATTITTLASTTGNITNVNATTIDTTNIEVTNIKAKDGTAAGSIADSTGVVTLASSVLTTTDINGGTIDGTAIGGSTAAAGSFTTLGASSTATFAAGAVGTPAITTTGDTNTGIFFPAADTIAFAEGGAEAMRIDSSGNLGLGVTPSAWDSAFKNLQVGGSGYSGSFFSQANGDASMGVALNGYYSSGWKYTASGKNATKYEQNAGVHSWSYAASGTADNNITFTQAMTLDASGNLGIGTSSPASRLEIIGVNPKLTINANDIFNGRKATLSLISGASADPFSTCQIMYGAINSTTAGTLTFVKGDGTESARITSTGNLFVGKTAQNLGVAGFEARADGSTFVVLSGDAPLYVNRLTNDGNLVNFYQDTALEGSISVSGNTVSYNAFSGGHWSQLQQGRGYNPDIPRGTVMSTIGEMCLWKSVEWTETTEHPAIPAVEAKEAVLDEEGNVIEPAVEAVEGKDAWTETSDKRDTYLGDLPVGATFEEDGFTKTVVDDGNERLPKVKISDVMGDKAVYGVFQTWDEAQDMLVTSLGAFVVRIAAGVTVEIGDLLESNGDGCAKVQDDDVIRSKTIAKVTSTTPTATYDDGSYTVPAVIYCG